MKIDFDLNYSKYERLSSLLNSVENRIDKINKLRSSLDKQMGREISKYQFDTSIASDGVINAYQMKMFIVGAKFYSFKEKYDLTLNSISEMKSTIFKDKALFNNGKNNQEFNNQDNAINENQYDIALDARKERILAAKVSQKMSNNYKYTLPNAIRRNIVKLNNESEHINNALAEIAELKKEIINDYIQKKQNALNSEVLALRNTTHSGDSLISEQISEFKPSDESSSLISIDTPIQDQKLNSHRVCLGRTAMCGATH
ncbi:hypothetical protein GKR50_01045 [Providencia rustigianii]|uniref:hypothetical protein n=1 Tax=Providencia rustigianii TaxID=158850 RepID=UPI000F6DA920|nr:hypothetical protein [Providencia rustigianii]MTC58611.1 hypothetical protein [Providencia rustigianii]VEH56983.1 Uncharacterised protein [Providencia rustigianii]